MNFVFIWFNWGIHEELSLRIFGIEERIQNLYHQYNDSQSTKIYWNDHEWKQINDEWIWINEIKWWYKYKINSYNNSWIDLNESWINIFQRWIWFELNIIWIIKEWFDWI